VAGKKTQPRPSYLPETWKAARAPHSPQPWTRRAASTK
jgi:hypothetical protein